MEIQVGGEVEHEKTSARVISTDSSWDSNIYMQFGDTLVLSDPENSRNILFTCFSSDIYVNDNLSSFAGSCKAENENNKTLQNEPSQHCCNEEFEMPDTFPLIPRLSVPLLCNFMLATYVLKRNDC